MTRHFGMKWWKVNVQNHPGVLNWLISKKVWKYYGSLNFIKNKCESKRTLSNGGNDHIEFFGGCCRFLVSSVKCSLSPFQPSKMSLDNQEDGETSQWSVINILLYYQRLYYFGCFSGALWIGAGLNFFYHCFNVLIFNRELGLALETALQEDASLQTVLEICQGKSIPHHIRSQVYENIYIFYQKYTMLDARVS